MTDETTLPILLKFEPNKMAWMSWRSRYQNFIKLQKVTEEEQKRVLLDSLGVEAYEMVHAMCLPNDPADKTLAEVLAKLERAYVKKTLKSTEWAKYFVLKQDTGETLLDFANKLRKKAILCSFPADVLEDNMKATFLNGLQGEATRRHLMSKDYDTLDKALELAEQFELSQASAKKAPGGVDVAGISGGLRRSGGQNRQRGNRRGMGQRARGGGAGQAAASSGAKCYGCGNSGHVRADCWAKDVTCRNCNKKGHIAKICTAPRQNQQRGDGRRTMLVEEEFDVLAVEAAGSQSIRIPLKLNGTLVSAVLDTGSGVTIVTAETWRRIGSPRLSPYTQPLRSFTGHALTVIGTATVDVQRASVRKQLPVVVVGRGGDVIGRDWIRALDLCHMSLRDLQSGALYSVASSLEEVFDRRKEVFCDELDHCKREAVEKDLERLVERGILTPVEHADWAAPIVGTLKRAGDVRTCADLSTGLNDSLDVQKYPLPTPDELFAKLNGGEKFSTLDLAEAYAQVELDDDSKQLVVINTHKGLFRYNRLPFGVASGPSIFQQIMEQILHGCEGVAIYLDDIIVTGATDEEHLRNLEKVMARLTEHGLTLKRSKCHFMQLSVEYLGFIVDSRGRHISRNRVKALLDMGPPKNVSELRAFLGMVNHYAKFVKNLSAKCHVFHNLLKADVTWAWSKQCEEQFAELKQEIARATFLVHYDPAMPLIVAADASQYGIGAVLCHRFPDGTERPIAHASGALTPPRPDMGRLRRKLALVFGCKKFHQRTEEFGQADGLSRLPLHSTELTELGNLGMDSIVNAVHTENAGRLPVSVETVAKETCADAELSIVLDYVQTGWPSVVREGLRPYKRLESELVTVNGCLCWGTRTVIPKKRKAQILSYLHESHLGAAKMKGEARGYCWWPSMDRDVERVSKACRICTERAGETAKVPLSQWPVPVGPWRRLHVDFAGPFHGTMLFVVVDGMSKWPEVVSMRHATTDAVIEALLDMFSHYGPCTEIVSDNGTQFTSEQFSEFCQQYGIRHFRTPPGHPQSNGQAERYVQTVKDGVSKLMADQKRLPVALREFLWRYRNAPHATTGKTPAELFLGRKMRSTLDLLVPVLLTTAEKNRERHRRNFDQHTRKKDFRLGDLVLVRDYRPSRAVDWISGKLIKRESRLIWEVQVSDLLWRRHANQIRPRFWLETPEHTEADTGNGQTAVETSVTFPPTKVMEKTVSPARARTPTSPTQPQSEVKPQPEVMVQPEVKPTFRPSHRN
ncbi:uncharacterized protein K02A2.6-like [Paramacrobiotus metropolitanus]|uniref:uncharacterized protein K02A2.6-like n=1 Tax=Paramacrobiotus metropolitanus TaxID=2943436 RepID=UPI0024461ED5|nr:uncharacterized protein K02A2.6-like [Paramacrobiotus metropolitanus]